MKSYKSALIALAVLAIVIGGFFVAKNIIADKQKNQDDGSKTDTSTAVVLSFKADDVTGIETVGGAENFTLQKDDAGTWECKMPQDLKLGSSSVSDLLTAINDLKGTIVYAKDEYKGDYKEFGLDTASSFTLIMKDGSKLTVKVGGMNPAGTLYYLMQDGSNEIFTVSSMYGKKLKLTRNVLIAGNLIELSDSENIKNIEIYKNGEKFCVIDAVTGDSDTAWMINYPVRLSGNTSAVKKLTDSLLAMEVFDLVEAGCKDLAKYGMDVPAFKFKVSDKAGSASCEIGNKTADGGFYYCTINGGSDVYRLNSDDVTFSDNTVLSYADSYAFFEDYTTLSSINIEIMGDVKQNRKLSFKFEGENETISLDGVAAEGKDELYSIKGITTYCYAVQLDGIDLNAPTEKGELLARITYNRLNGTKCTVEAYKRDDATMYLYKDGEYFGGYCDSWRVFSTTDHQGLWGTIKAYEA